MMKDLHAYGRWIRGRRENLNLTQAEAANIARISRVRWSQIERGEGRIREPTVRKMVKAVEGRLGHAFYLLGYPEQMIERAYAKEKSSKEKLEKAKKDFLNVMLTEWSRTKMVLRLINLCAEFREEDEPSEFETGSNPLAYRKILEQVTQLDNYHQWLLGRAIIAHLWESGRMPCFPQIPEYDEINKEQTRILQIAAKNIKEFRIKSRLKYASDTDEMRKAKLFDRSKHK